jgi:hypothetical protein
VFAVAARRLLRGPGWQVRAPLPHPGIRAFVPRVHLAVNPRSETSRRPDVVLRGLPYLSHRPARVTIRVRGRVFDLSSDFADLLSIRGKECRPTEAGPAE